MPNDDAKQFREGDRLANELGDSQPLGFLLLLLAPTAAHDDDSNAGGLRVLELLPAEAQTVHERHPQIEQDQAGLGLRAQQVEGVLPVCDATSSKTFLSKERADPFPEGAIVLDDENSVRWNSFFLSPPCLPGLAGGGESGTIEQIPCPKSTKPS